MKIRKRFEENKQIQVGSSIQNAIIEEALDQLDSLKHFVEVFNRGERLHYGAIDPQHRK